MIGLLTLDLFVSMKKQFLLILIFSIRPIYCNDFKMDHFEWLLFWLVIIYSLDNYSSTAWTVFSNHMSAATRTPVERASVSAGCYQMIQI